MAEKIPFGVTGHEINVFVFDKDVETLDAIIEPNKNYRIFKAGDVVVEVDSDKVRVFKSLDEYVRYERWISDGDLDTVDLVIATQETSPFRL
jgi:hypothetical protein